MTPGLPTGASRSTAGLQKTRIWCLGFLLLVLPISAVSGPVGRSPSGTATADSVDSDGLPTIATIRRDADEDAVPDRIGDTVMVAGRVTSPKGVHPVENLIFVQDPSAGIAVRAPDETEVRVGDSLHVRGVIRHRYGLTQIDALSADSVEVDRTVPAPLPVTVSTVQREAFEGRLVRLRARVVRTGMNDGGQYLILADPADDATARIAAFVPGHRLNQYDLDRFDPGTEIAIAGPLSQYDYSEPYTEYYQLLPRSPDDLNTTGVLSPYYMTGIVLIVGAALLAVILVLTLRGAVKRRTKQLAESRARFRRLAEATFEGIIIHEEGEIIDVNRALIEMTGYEREELVGRDFLNVLSESTRDLVRETVRPNPLEPYEAVMVRKDGSTFPVEVEEKKVDVPDQRICVTAIRDVTERKKWETEILLAKEEAEEMAQLKSSLLNNMSHELRTPITSILGYAELIVNEPDGDHERFAARIRQSGKRLSRTLRSVLDMAQIESGTLEIEPNEVNVEALVRAVIEEHRPMLDEKNLALSVESGAPGVSLYTDPDLVYRILGNLLHNAVKFTEEGHIAITVESIDAGIQVSIADSGIGIDPDFRDTLFEPFTQESDGRTRAYEGTGLGLALTQRMIDRLGGRIEVQSVKDEGSTFVVQLPPLIPADKTEPSTLEADVA